MKRLLQLVSALLAVLAVALGWKLTQVLSVAPPVFEDAPQQNTSAALPPVPRNSSNQRAVIDSVVGGNLFETERGYRETPADASVEIDETPLPPPTNVLLNGVFFARGGRPMVIMTDTSSGNKQLTLGEGDNVGDYQVGRISDTRVTLLGRGGQQFSVELDIKKGAQSGSSRPARTTPASRAAQARTNNNNNNNQAQTPAQRAAQARAAAQRAAQQRAQQARQRANGNAEGEQRERTANQPPQKDATQARLEALKRLREAAAAR